MREAVALPLVSRDRNHGRPFTRPQRYRLDEPHGRSDVGALGMRTDHGFRSEAVEQDQALLVVANVEIFAQRPGRAVLENAVVGLDAFASLTLGVSLVCRDPGNLIHRAEIGPSCIQ